MTDDDLVDLCRRATRAVVEVLSAAPDWGLVPGSAHQHHSDLAADAAAVPVLLDGGVGVLSEESGWSRSDRTLLAVLDPLDGSTNAAQGIPWYACSLCVVDDSGPRVALVTNLARGVEYGSVRGAGAWRCDPGGTVERGGFTHGGSGRRLQSSDCRSLDDAIIGVAGYPPRHLGWRQFRALGAAALDLCAVAEGALDAWIDCSPHGHAVWDYLGGMLICQESGVAVTELAGDELVVTDHGARRWPALAATPELLASLTGAIRA